MNNDEMSSKIKQLADMLGQDDAKDNLKALFGLLADSGNNSGSSNEESNANSASNGNKVSSSLMDDKLDMMRKLKMAAEIVSSKDDPRTNLLLAIRPYLSNKRRSKLSNYIKILQLTRLAGHIDDFTNTPT